MAKVPVSPSISLPSNSLPSLSLPLTFHSIHLPFAHFVTVGALKAVSRMLLDTVSVPPAHLAGLDASTSYAVREEDIHSTLRTAGCPQKVIV